MLFNKPPLSVPDQIRLLQGRGMVIADEARATRVLQHINYYRLRAYWLPFETQPTDAEHAFRLGTDFDNVVGLYVFDRKLRVLLLEAIERVEIAMRTHWAQVLAERYGSHAYCCKGRYFKIWPSMRPVCKTLTMSCDAAKKPLCNITATNTLSLPGRPFGQFLSC